jgi:hypothetical protein
MRLHFVTACWLLPCTATALFAANSGDSFVGNWLFNEAESKVSAYETIENMGNRFKIIEWPFIYTVIADGTDQKAEGGRTLSIKPAGANAWHVVWKTKGAVQDETVWSVSPDGQTLTMIGTFHEDKGKTDPIHKILKRITGTSGFAGVWEVTEFTTPRQRFSGQVHRERIRPYGNNG